MSNAAARHRPAPAHRLGLLGVPEMLQVRCWCQRTALQPHPAAASGAHVGGWLCMAVRCSCRGAQLLGASTLVVLTTVRGVRRALREQAGWCCPQTWSRSKSASTQCSRSDGGHVGPCSQF